MSKTATVTQPEDYPQSSEAVRIGIIGSGPAGLALALALEHYTPKGSVEVTIMDRNASVADYPGVEYGIQQRACRALARIGVRERALQRGMRANEIRFYNARLGKQFRSIQSDPDNTRSVVRQEFLADMTALLKTTTFQRSCMIEDCSPLGDGKVRASGSIRAGGDFAFDYDLVVACDGGNSTMRQKFFPIGSQRQDRGFSCIYMMVEITEWSTASEDLLSLANAGRSEIVMGSICTLTLFPLGRNRLAFGIGFDHVTRRAIWAKLDLEESVDWSALTARQKEAVARMLVQDASHPGSAYEEALGHIQDWDSYKIYLWGMQDTDALDCPFIQDVNVILIGDSAHAIMPTIGMGASLAIEDGEILGRRIADHLATVTSRAAFRGGLSQQVFAPFTADRVSVWKELIRRARLAAEQNFINVAAKKRFALGPQIPNDAISRFVSLGETILRRLNL
jgi:salicylate hydroxylase